MQTQVANLRAPEDHHPSIKTDPEALPLRLAPGMMRTYKAGQNRARPHRIFALSGKEVYLQSAAFVKIQRYFRGDLLHVVYPKFGIDGTRISQPALQIVASFNAAPYAEFPLRSAC